MIIPSPAIVQRYTKLLQRPGLVTVDKDGNSHPLLSNEALARFFKRLADRLQGVVSDTSTVTITPEYNFKVKQAPASNRRAFGR